MIIADAIRNMIKPTWTRPELMSGYVFSTASGQAVSPESAKRIATVYRCANTIAKDFAKIPLQQYISRKPGEIERVRPDGFRRNNAYLVEVQPNRGQLPFIVKYTAMMWLLFWGDCYIWTPPRRFREMFVLPSSSVEPIIKDDGQVYYRVQFSDGIQDLPYPEVVHVMINSTDGLKGKSVLTYARESVGTKQGYNEVRDKLNNQGLMPGAMVHFDGDLSKEARAKVQASYSEAVSGSGNAGRLLVLDGKVSKFETIPVSASDAQFIENSQATDVDIANFFEFPLYKLNMGKEAYNSNEQQKMDYLDGTLDPYMVQWEQAAQIGWLTTDEQAYSYWRFNRDAFLRTDAKTRSEVVRNRLLSGQIEINEARAIEDQPRHPGGDVLLVPSNMAIMDRAGNIKPISANSVSIQTGG